MLGTFEAHAKLAEAWFTFLGFVAITAIFHAAADKSDFYQLVVLKWASYLLLLNWVYYKLNQLIWFVYPPADIVKGKPSNLVIGISVWLASLIMFFVYNLVPYLVEVFISATK